MFDLRTANFRELVALCPMAQDNHLSTLLTLMTIAAAIRLGSVIVTGPGAYRLSTEVAVWANEHGAALVR